VAVVRELIARFGIDFDPRGMNQGVAAVEGFGSKLRQLGGLIAGSAIVAGTYRLAESVASFADDLADTGQAFGFTSEQLLAFRTAAAGAGVEGEALNGVLAALSRNVQDAGSNPATARMFQNLGVAIKNADGSARSMPDILRDTAVGLNGIQNPAERTATALHLLGRQGALLLPAFADGGAGVAALEAEVNSLFGNSLQEASAAADELERSQARWNLSTQAIKTTIGLQLLPIVNGFIAKGAELATAFGKLTRGTTIVKQALVVLGAAAVVAGVKMLIPFLPVIAVALLVAAAFGVVFLFVDDLIALFSGGRSVIGEFIDSIFGVGAAAKTVAGTKQGFREIGEAWRGIFAGNGELSRSFSDAWLMATDATWLYFTKLADDLEAMWISLGETLMAPIDTLQEALGTIASDWRDIGQSLGVVATPSRPNAAARNPAALVPTAPGVAPGGVNVRQQNTVGQIVIQGSADPEATAEAVQARLRATAAADLEAARNALAGRR